MISIAWQWLVLGTVLLPLPIPCFLHIHTASEDRYHRGQKYSQPEELDRFAAHAYCSRSTLTPGKRVVKRLILIAPLVSQVLFKLLELTQPVTVEGLKDHLRQKPLPQRQKFLGQRSRLFDQGRIQAFQAAGLQQNARVFLLKLYDHGQTNEASRDLPHVYDHRRKNPRRSLGQTSWWER